MSDSERTLVGTPEVYRLSDEVTLTVGEKYVATQSFAQPLRAGQTVQVFEIKEWTDGTVDVTLVVYYVNGSGAYGARKVTTTATALVGAVESV